MSARFSGLISTPDMFSTSSVHSPSFDTVQDSGMHATKLSSTPVALNVDRSGICQESVVAIVSASDWLTAYVPFCTRRAALASVVHAPRLAGVNRKDGSEQASVQFRDPDTVVHSLGPKPSLSGRRAADVSTNSSSWSGTDSKYGTDEKVPEFWNQA